MTFISYAQNGEDVILWRALGAVENGFYIDVGACDPVEHSVTKAFYDRGWRGINIEPVPHYFEMYATARPEDINLNVAVTSQAGVIDFTEVENTGLSTTVGQFADEAVAKGFAVCKRRVIALRLADIFSTLDLGEIHFLKIDVEGAEGDVLSGMDFGRYRPWVIVIEATAPLSTDRVDHLWENILLDAQYDKVFFDGLNLYFVAHEHQDLSKKISIPANVFDDFKVVTLVECEDKNRQLESYLAESEEKFAKNAEVLESVIKAEACLRVEKEKSDQKLEELKQQMLRESARADARYGFVSQKLYQSHGEIIKLEDEIERLNKKIANSEIFDFNISKSDDVSLDMAEKFMKLKMEMDLIVAHRDKILSSTSWRSTMPLRKVKTAAKTLYSAPGEFWPLVRRNLR